MTRQEYAEQTSSEFAHGIVPGLCASCGECQDAHGIRQEWIDDLNDYETDEKMAQRFADAISCGDVEESGGFSRQPCDCCGSRLGGNRYAAHGHVDGTLFHLDICADCLMWLANGDPIPEDKADA